MKIEMKSAHPQFTLTEMKIAEWKSRQKKDFWPLMAVIAALSLVAAFVIAHVSYRGESRVFVAAIWFVLTLIGYCALAGRD